MRAIAAAARVSAGLVIHHFGSKDALRRACDDHIIEEIRSSKSESIQSSDPATWFAQMAEIEDYAPMMAYLARSMQSGSDLAKALWHRMLDNTEESMDIELADRDDVGRMPIGMLVPTGALIAVGLALTVLAGPIFAYSERAAYEVVDRGQYISAVLGQGQR